MIEDFSCRKTDIYSKISSAVDKESNRHRALMGRKVLWKKKFFFSKASQKAMSAALWEKESYVRYAMGESAEGKNRHFYSKKGRFYRAVRNTFCWWIWVIPDHSNLERFLTTHFIGIYSVPIKIWLEICIEKWSNFNCWSLTTFSIY